MITRRTLLATTAIATAGASVGGWTVWRDPVLRADIFGGSVLPLPPPPEAAAEFAAGDVEIVHGLVLARSEAAWLNANHPDIADPYEIVELLQRR